ncbi:hypothetical protein AC1031_015159 [Aphanomyces cochlioides]|nr:hypothetical protein AC1031_015159 [Aphanomyces cochlioides]
MASLGTILDERHVFGKRFIERLGQEEIVFFASILMLFYRDHVLDVLMLLEAYQEDVYAVERSLTEMSRLLREKPECRDELHAHNFVARVCSCAQAHAFDLDISICLCIFLEQLLRHGDIDVGHHSYVVESGLWKIVFESMKRDSENVELHVRGFALIESLCYESPFVSHEPNQTDMVASGALDMIRRTMDAKPVLGVLVAGAKTITGLCYKNKATAERAIKVDIFQLFSMTLHSFFKEPEVVKAIANAIFQLLVATSELAQHAFLQWGLVDRFRACLASQVHDLDAEYSLLRAVEVALRYNETAKDAFCAKEIPFHLVTNFEEMHEAYSTKTASVAFICAVIFGSVAVSNFENDTCTWSIHPTRIQLLIKASVHLFATSSLTHFSKDVPVLEQCTRLIELLAMPGMSTSIVVDIDMVDRDISYDTDTCWSVTTHQVYPVQSFSSRLACSWRKSSCRFGHDVVVTLLHVERAISGYASSIMRKR